MTKRYRLLKDLPGFLIPGLGFDVIKAGAIFVYDGKLYCYGEVLHITPYIIENNPDWFELITEQDMSIFEVGNIVVGKDGEHVEVEGGDVHTIFRGRGFYGSYINKASNVFLFSILHGGPWTLVKKAEVIKPKAPAYVWDDNKHKYQVTTYKPPYESQEDAVLGNLNWKNVQWPALIDKETGMYPGPK